MELVLSPTPSLPSLICHLVATYVGLTDFGTCSIVYEEEEKEKEVPRIELKDGKNVTTVISIIRVLVSQTEFRQVLLGESDKYLQACVDQWLSFISKKMIESDLTKEECKLIEEYIIHKTFFGTVHVSLADIAMFPLIHKWIATCKYEERVECVSVLRWFDHMQHLPGIMGVFSELPVIADVFKNENVSKKVTDPMSQVQSDFVSQLQSDSVSQSVTPQPKRNRKTDAKKTKTKKENPNAESSSVTPAEIVRPWDDPTRLRMVVGRVVNIWHHESAEKLFCEEIDIGEASPRMIASGLRDYYSLDQIKGMKVIILANMKPKSLRGFMSHGMIMCASMNDKTEILMPHDDAEVGELVRFDGIEWGDNVWDDALSSKKGKETFSLIAPRWSINETGNPIYMDSNSVPHVWSTAKGPIRASSIRSGGSVS